MISDNYTVSVRPVDPEKDLDHLLSNLHDQALIHSIWLGPLDDEADFEANLALISSSHRVRNLGLLLLWVSDDNLRCKLTKYFSHVPKLIVLSIASFFPTFTEKVAGIIAAANASALTQRASTDGLTRVKEMTEVLATRMRNSADEEMTQRTYCDREPKTNKATHEKINAVTSLQAEVDELNATIGKLGEDAVKFTDDLPERNKAMSTCNTINDHLAFLKDRLALALLSRFGGWVIDPTSLLLVTGNLHWEHQTPLIHLDVRLGSGEFLLGDSLEMNLLSQQPQNHGFGPMSLYNIEQCILFCHRPKSSSISQPTREASALTSLLVTIMGLVSRKPPPDNSLLQHIQQYRGHLERHGFDTPDFDSAIVLAAMTERLAQLRPCPGLAVFKEYFSLLNAYRCSRNNGLDLYFGRAVLSVGLNMLPADVDYSFRPSLKVIYVNEFVILKVGMASWSPKVHDKRDAKLRALQLLSILQQSGPSEIIRNIAIGLLKNISRPCDFERALKSTQIIQNLSIFMDRLQEIRNWSDPIISSAYRSMLQTVTLTPVIQEGDYVLVKGNNDWVRAKVIAINSQRVIKTSKLTRISYELRYLNQDNTPQHPGRKDESDSVSIYPVFLSRGDKTEHTVTGSLGPRESDFRANPKLAVPISLNDWTGTHFAVHCGDIKRLQLLKEVCNPLKEAELRLTQLAALSNKLSSLWFLIFGDQIEDSSALTA